MVGESWCEWWGRRALQQVRSAHLVKQTGFPHPHVTDDDIFKDELEHCGKRPSVAAANEQGQLRDKCQENNRLAYRCVYAAQLRKVLLLIRGRVQACG